MKTNCAYEAFQGNFEAFTALNIIEQTNESLCIYGSAGTGKSTLIETLLQSKIKRIITLAPTNVAANNINGLTIHSFFRFPRELAFPDQQKINSIHYGVDSQDYFSYAECIIIDEISMVSAYLMDCIDLTLRRLYNNKMPFGGMQMIFVGDPYQLAPIVKKRDIPTNKQYSSDYFFYSKAFKELNPLVMHLEHNYRQDESEYVNALEAIRNGIQANSAVDFLNAKCLIGNNMKALPDDHITLAANNELANKINRDKLESLIVPLYTFEAILWGQHKINETLCEQKLELKAGARVMFIKDHKNYEYTKGELGTIHEISDSHIQIRTGGGKLINLDKEEWEWGKTKRFKYGGEWKSEFETIGKVKQYPIILAWAITIHKSQGLTFDSMFYANDCNVFSSGQLYVALSRCKKVDGLKIKFPLKYKDVITDKIVSQYYEKALKDLRFVDIAYEMYRNIETKKTSNIGSREPDIF